VSYRIGMVELAGQATAIVDTGGGAFRLAELVPGQPPGLTQDISIQDMLPEWPHWHAAISVAVETPRGSPVDMAASRWLAPLPTPPKMICIGVNYRDHIAEMGVTELPRYPYAFLRPSTCLAAHEQAVVLPNRPRMIDWEAELGLVIGSRVRDVSGAEALAAVAFYTVINDISARDWIENRPFVGIDWVMQKAWDGFQPTGPWLTPASLVPDPQSLPIRLAVNGVVKQQSNTAQMVFGVAAIIEHLSKIMTLEPGDIIATGTPAGVGFGRSPREFLKAGDIVEVSVGELGTLRNRMA